MQKYMLIAVAAFLLGFPALGSATTAEPGAYVTGFLGVSIPRDADVTGFDFDDEVEFDPGIYLGGSGGYDFGLVRLEGELSYRYSEIDTIAEQGGTTYRNVDGNLGVFATMFNCFLDLHNASPVTPYLGGGIGFATLHLSNTYGRDNFGKFIFYGSGDDTVFAYQGGAGIEIAFNRQLSMDLGYRYFATDDAEFDSHNDIFSSMKFQSHNASVGIRVKF